MKDTMATTMSRRDWLSRLLLAAAVAPVVGVRLADPVAADKKKKTAKQKKVEAYKRTCETNGGTATIESFPGGTTVTCTGGKDASGDPQNWTCTVHSKGSRCHANLTTPPTTPLNDTTAPPTGGVEQPTSGANPGGGGAVDPTGGNEQPPAGGANPGGGGAVDPPGTADPNPSDGGGVILTAYDDNHDNSKQRGKHKNRGHGGKRGKH
jgi:hypothetical protein